MHLEQYFIVFLTSRKVFILYQLAHMALYNTVTLTHENKSFIVDALPKGIKPGLERN